MRRNAAGSLRMPSASLSPDWSTQIRRMKVRSSSTEVMLRVRRSHLPNFMTMKLLALRGRQATDLQPASRGADLQQATPTVALISTAPKVANWWTRGRLLISVSCSNIAMQGGCRARGLIWCASLTVSTSLDERFKTQGVWVSRGSAVALWLSELGFRVSMLRFAASCGCSWGRPGGAAKGDRLVGFC